MKRMSLRFVLLVSVAIAALVAHTAAHGAPTVAFRGYKGEIPLPGPGLATVEHFSIKAKDWRALRIKTNEAHLPAGIRAVAVIGDFSKTRLAIVIAINNLTPHAAPLRTRATVPHDLTFEIVREAGPGTALFVPIGKPAEATCDGLISTGNEIDAGRITIDTGDYKYEETVHIQVEHDELAALVPFDVQPSPDEEVWDNTAYNSATHRNPACPTGAPTGVELPDTGNS